MVAVAFGLPPWQLALTMSSRQSLLCGCGDDLDDDISAACRLGGHLIAVHDQFRAGLHRILRDLLNITSTTDKSDIPTHPSVGAGHADGQREQGDVYLKLPDNSHLASVIGELVLDVSRSHTHERNSAPKLPKHLQTQADAKYRKHSRAYKALDIAFLPVLADTLGRLLADALRLLYHAATLKASGNVATQTSSGVSGRIIASALGGRPSTGATKTARGSFSPPSARSSGTVPIASPSPLQGRGSREGGVVTVTSASHYQTEFQGTICMFCSFSVVCACRRRSGRREV